MEAERHIHESLSEAYSSPHEIEGEDGESILEERPFSTASQDTVSLQSDDDMVSPHACPQTQEREKDVQEEATEFGENVELF